MKIAFLLLPTLAAAQGPVFRSDTNIVEVAIVARDAKDWPVGDLKRSDFHVFDNGVEQKILSFERLGGVIAATGLPRERLSIILLDSLNTSWSLQVAGRNAVLKMLEKSPRGPDRIAIFTLGDKLRLLHDFTDDGDALRAVVERYGTGLPSSGVDDPLAASDGHAAPPPLTVGPPGARGLMTVRPSGDTPADPARQSQRLILTLDALRTIARMMKDAPGEKNLLWVTAGFPPPSEHQSIQSAMRDLAAAKLMLYPIDARGILTGIRSYTNLGSMKELAEQTGGRVYFNSNDTAVLVKGAFNDSREGYILTYAPRDYKRDGSAHIVRLKTSRKGVTLRYRPGYVADYP